MFKTRAFFKKKNIIARNKSGFALGWYVAKMTELTENKIFCKSNALSQRNSYIHQMLLVEHWNRVIHVRQRFVMLQSK